jgi:molybdopterin synthase catalytic subunit
MSMPTHDRAVVVTDTPLSIDAVVGRVQHPGVGAVVVMIGCVRDHTRKDGTTVAVHRLEYEAYAEMAEAVIAGHCRDLEAATPGLRCAVAHRVGDLRPGDLAVVVAAASPHRAEAFDGCRALIERLKHDAPIWKREHGDDGITWVGLGP